MIKNSAFGKPNIIFILADDLGYGDLGCYGQTKIKTPNLDRLAAEGMRFTQAYAGGCVSAPSRAALLTGRHTGHSSIRSDGDGELDAGEPTVAEVLKNAQYLTCALGKWGLGAKKSTPNQRGFGQWLGYLEAGHAQQAFPDYLWRNERKLDVRALYPGPPVYAQNMFTAAATNFIRTSKGFPFFLYLAYTAPHANLELAKKTGNGMEAPSLAPYAAENWPAPEKGKAAMITRMDEDIGRILDALAAHKIADKTLVLFSSDNGPHQEGGVKPEFFHSAGPLRGGKRDLYEGGLRVPLIARWPERIPSGTTNEQAVAFWDFLPTAAALADAPPRARLDGVSLVPMLLGRAQTNRHEYLYWESRENGLQQAARWGNWKAIRKSPEAPLELYDLKSDPAEKTDAAAQQPAVVKKMEAILQAARTTTQKH